jgi:pyridine nucleotide-disulfide oxidoreductase
MDRSDVAIIGAGPYGLSAAAHLRQIPGLDIRLFGEPMSFWERHMPRGMRLRSPWLGSHIADPEKRFTLDAYRDAVGPAGLAYPVPAADFVKYGRWFQEQAAVPAHRSTVTRIEPGPGGFQLSTEEGRTFLARRVIIASGIQPFAYRPDIFKGLPASLVSHTSEAVDCARFRDKQVIVVGAGQSALEAAGFMAQAGAQVQVLTRNPSVHWLGRRPWMHGKALGWLLYAKSDIGPAGVSQIVHRPNLFRRLPRRLQAWWGPRSVRPAVLDTLVAQVQNLTIRGQRFPVEAVPYGDRLRVRLNDGSECLADHVVLGTGYRVNVARYPFLPAEFVERIDRVDGYPRLDSGFETSVPSLHFLGAPAAWSFGPLMRFVAGTEFTARALAKRVGRATERSRVAVPGPLLRDASGAERTL